MYLIFNQVIPRTQRIDVKAQNLSTDDFLKILMPKLEAVKKEQERMELLNKKLLEVNLFYLFLFLLYKEAYSFFICQSAKSSLRFKNKAKITMFLKHF